MGKRNEAGRDRDGTEPVEYCDSRFFEARDIGRGATDRRAGGEVIKGVKVGWFGFVVVVVVVDSWCDGAAGGETTGDEYDEDMIAVIDGRETGVSLRMRTQKRSNFVLVLYTMRIMWAVSLHTIEPQHNSRPHDTHASHTMRLQSNELDPQAVPRSRAIPDRRGQWVGKEW